MSDMNFKQEDFDFTQDFARFVLNKMYVREASVKEMLDFNKMLVRYNELCRKIEANIFEIKSVTEPEPKPKKSKSVKTGE
jgi:hypothetical protein